MEDYANGKSNVATVTAEQCKIIHIPDKPPVPPHLQPTMSVHAAVIEPKHANALVRKLNQMVPMEKFRHVKRVRKKCLDGGKIELSVILCLASECEDQWDGMPKDVLELINQYQLSTFVTKVCKYAASTKEEWEEQCKLWPTSYHPPTYNISGITGFTEEEAQSVLGFMQYAVDLAKSSSDMVVNAAAIVDPSTKQVISSACDQVPSLTIPRNKTGIESSCLNHHEANTSIEAEKPQVVLSCHSSCDPEQLYNSVSCLHPWQWTEQLSPISSGSWHPLQHAAMVAIEYSAARDRLLFPNSGNRVDELVQEDIMLSDTKCLPSKRQKVDCNKAEDDENFGCKTNSSLSYSARPYLCTGYDIYLVWEPCTMCAMALVHQRVKRIFYAFPNPNAGALGSIHRLQGQRSLNHHYAVFRVLIPDVLRNGSSFASNSENYQITT